MSNTNNINILLFNTNNQYSATQSIFTQATQLGPGIVICLLEPTLIKLKTLLHLNRYITFTPTLISPRAVIYIPIHTNVEPVESISRDNYMIGVNLTVLQTGTEVWKLSIINLNSLGGDLKIGIKSSYHIPEKSNTILVRDFNPHHPLWYESRPIARAYTFPAYTMEVDKMVENLMVWGFHILNQLDRPIHYPHNGTIPSVLDLAFAQGPVSNNSHLTYKDKLRSDHCYSKIQTSFNTIYSSPTLWS